MLKAGTLLQRIDLIRKALGLIWNAAKGWTTVWFCLLFIQGLLPAAMVYLTKLLVDGVADALGGGLSWENVAPAAIAGALLAACLILMQVLQGLLGWVKAAQAELVQDSIKQMIHKKAAAVDLEFYETPAYFDQINRANSQADTRSMSILQNLGAMIQNIVTLVAIAGLLIPYALWLPLVLIVSTLPALWVVLKHNKFYHAWWESTTEKRRWLEYYDSVLTVPLIAPEVRIFNLADRFQNLFMGLRKELRESRLRLMRNQNIANIWAGVSALIVMGATMLWMVWRAFQGLATLGDLALFYQAFSQGQGLMRILMSSFGHLFADAQFLEHLFNFMELEPRVKDPAKPEKPFKSLHHGIEIKDVSFRYPGSDHLALRDFSLFIPAGQMVAIVGANGAGKSTLIKLICRFYDPEEGRVLMDGVDIRDMKIADVWSRISILFQYYVNYAGTVRENIAMSDHQLDGNSWRFDRAVVSGGARDVVKTMPDGYSTRLGKQFSGGVDLSGGQWQRLALSRAFYRDAPILILDEPTSYMDSWAEIEWLERLRDTVAGQTCIVVTHRFTTAMRADMIHVMDAGRVVESGTHEDLISRDTLYAQSWRAQTNAKRKLEVDA